MPYDYQSSAPRLVRQYMSASSLQKWLQPGVGLGSAKNVNYNTQSECNQCTRACVPTCSPVGSRLSCRLPASASHLPTCCIDRLYVAGMALRSPVSRKRHYLIGTLTGLHTGAPGCAFCRKSSPATKRRSCSELPLASSFRHTTYLVGKCTDCWRFLKTQSASDQLATRLLIHASALFVLTDNIHARLFASSRRQQAMV